MRKSIIALAVFCSVFSAFAQKTFTVSEFKSYVENYKITSGDESETVSIKIKDVLSSETQNSLVTLTWETRNSKNLYFDLDLSECTYADDDCILELFHIKNVRRCVLPMSTKRLRYFDCMQLEEITLPDGLEEINYNAFFDVPSLKRIEIPASVRYVGACAFGDCLSLEYILIDKNANTKDWSLAWNAWNDAKIVYSDEKDFSDKETDKKNDEPPVGERSTVAFDHANYHMWDDIAYTITLAEKPEKTQKANIFVYDVHNGGELMGTLPIKIKKNKTVYTFTGVPTQHFELPDTDLIYTILKECHEYWAKMKFILVLKNGDRIDLAGSARCYVTLP
ncbi:leucine-rich repeat protein [Treponema sp. Marseille-Q4523]|uniref:leucine-rich repeat protein n=1 Tax=Treponema sp. Marseille-Q4523 TaxID=2810610 RepID=UPI00195F8F14|nr:leucine-rich repeat protein [Treponema sp. Marseille-Q4523]MBM7022519.1 leucine-rich repeat protein [Treponema sp. Marseille-Q4523]